MHDEINLFIPSKEVIIRPRDKPGMTSGVRKLFRVCHHWHKIAQKSGSADDKKKHWLARKTAKKAWKSAKSEYFKKLAAQSSCKTKSYWKLIKSVIGKRNPKIPVIIDNDISYNSDLEKCNVFNNFFAEQSKLDSLKINDVSRLTHVTSDSFMVLENIEATEADVTKILNSLNIDKSSGPDDIGNRVLKSCSSALAYPISFLINKSLKSGCFPSQWKLSNVVPVYKKGDKQIKNNYRPVSLLSNTSKVFEKIVYNSLYDYCLKNGLLSTRNSGFKKNDGTVNQLLYLIDKIYKGLDDEKEIAVIFLDITNAFGRCWHKGLMYKLKKIGIRGNLLDWFVSYLSNRKQKVVIGGRCSQILELLAGVPQGSILGPLLFLIFLDDIEEAIESEINLFADDTILMKTYTSSRDAENTLNSDLLKIENWASKWLVEFNPVKTFFINFSLKQKKSILNLKFKNEKIVQVSEHKHLGVYFTSDMTWSKHINYISSKASQRLGQMYRSSIYLNKHQLSSVYLNMIRPILEYGSILYDNCSAADSRKLENIQRRAALIVSGAMRRTETSKLSKLLGWPSLENRRKFNKLVMFFKIVNNLTPMYLTVNIQCRALNINLRNIDNNKNCTYKTLTARLSCYHNSFFPSVIPQWNSLSSVTTDCTSTNMFRSHLKCLDMFILEKDINPLFDYSYGYYGKMLTQMSLGLSKLNHHLFAYNITDNPFCPKCYDVIETTEHYFLECSAYTVYRENMLSALHNCLNNYEVSNTNIVAIMLNGVLLKDNYQINNNIFTIVRTYMKLTERFLKS
jgi:hypothetical protein